MRSAHPPGRLAIAVSIALMCAIWGSTWIVIKGGLADLPPFTSAAARFFVAALVMSALAPLLHAREGGTPPPRRLWAIVGTANFGLSYGIVYWTETRLSSGIVALLWAVFPLIMAALAHRFLPGERLRARHWLGFVAGFAGVGLLFATDLAAFGPEGVPAACVLLASPLVSALGTLYLKRNGAGVSSVLINRNALWLGAALLGLAALAVERGVPARWSGAALLSVGYLAVAGTVVTFGLYFWLLRHAAAHKLGLIANVTPAIALWLGWALDDEPITVWTLTGGALVLVGVLLVVAGKRNRPRPA
jgi:drug/metabolite transporter (DMT)-like permease